MKVDTDNNTMVRVEPEPECKAHCTVCKYVTPKLVVGLAVEIMMKHKTAVTPQQPHQPPPPTQPRQTA